MRIYNSCCFLSFYGLYFIFHSLVKESKNCIGEKTCYRMPGAGDNHILQSDGVSEEFFALLWSKDEVSFGPSINIPDTVVFKHGVPVNWYFTATNGKIKRKNRQNLINERIEEAFNSHVVGYDVLATFISFPEEGDPHTNERPISTIEYFDKKTLYNFLYKQYKRKSGILQRFVEPKGTKNDIIRAVWSPKICLLERAENIYHLHDQRFGLYERCVTYEGPEYFSISSSLRGAVLAGQIQKVCESVVSHISEVTYGQKQVSRVVLNLKVDSRDKLWLLFTTSIRCDNDSFDTLRDSQNVLKKNNLNLDHIFSLPDVINLNPTKSYDEIANRKSKVRIRCVSCSDETLDDTRHPVSYKSIVKHYEHVLHLLSEAPMMTRKEKSAGSGAFSQSVMVNWPPDAEVIAAAGGVGFGCLDLIKNDDSSSSKFSVVDVNDQNILKISPILRYLHPKLNAVSYERCRKDPLFLYKTVTVCESCFLVYAEFTTMLLRMGQNITSFLKSEASVSKLRDESSIMTRPSSADWRAMSSVYRSTETSDGMQSGPSLAEFNPSDNHTHAKKYAIGIRTSDTRRQPGMPTAIRRGEDADQMNSQSRASTQGEPANGLFQNSTHTASSQYSNNSPSESKLSIYDVDPDYAAREKMFSKEMSRNPQLQSQHPLIHLINSQKKLNAKHSGVFSTSSNLESNFGSGYGTQKETDKYEKYASYKEELPFLINRSSILPSKLKQLKQLEKLKKQEKMKNNGMLQITESGSETGKKSESSHSHRNFLQDALKSIEVGL